MTYNVPEGPMGHHQVDQHVIVGVSDGKVRKKGAEKISEWPKTSQI